MPRKKVDSRIRTLVENGVKLQNRTFFIIVGDKGRDQVVNLHLMLSKSVVKTRPSVLWCYKKELGFSSHKKKRIRQIKKDIMRGMRDADTEDPFDLFISSTTIRYIYYKDTHKVLGNTYGMLVLQDFEALTPNLMARTIESVEGGGIVVLLLNTMASLKQLYHITMDVHKRFRTEAHQDVAARFNERLILSLSTCPTIIAVDDELNILPLTSHIRNIQPVSLSVDEKDPEQRELKELVQSLSDTQPAGTLVNLAKTGDQAKAVLTFLEAISEKTLRTTVALTAARGRGKSAALGIAISGAVAHGYANIFITSPSAENLKAFWQFVLKGFDAMEYQEHTDYEIIKGTSPELSDCVIRINVFREHRQTLQYIDPQDCQKLSQAEILVIDECAAIPLPMVKKLIGPYLVFLSSTVNGYEGTGRSLSLKLIKELRDQEIKFGKTSDGGTSGRQLREVTLETPIRYAPGDPVESWLNSILCLDSSKYDQTPKSCPHPSECDLYFISRDALFSYHKAAEMFLQKVWALYVSAHYKNSPNDLQLLSDAPAHGLFVLLGPTQSDSTELPEIFCVIQVAFEGAISQESILRNTARGARPTGDLIPWTLSSQFQDKSFAQLSGARVVRIATNPAVQKMGYGSRALDLLSAYYEQKFFSLDESNDPVSSEPDVASKMEIDSSSTLLTETLTPKKSLPPLLQRLDRRKPEPLHWLGVSFGLTQRLHNFWRASGFLPVYLRLTAVCEKMYHPKFHLKMNELTGEHTTIMIRTLDVPQHVGVTVSPQWLQVFNEDFRHRYVSLLAYEFRNTAPALALSILDPPKQKTSEEDSHPSKEVTYEKLSYLLTPYDLKRLESYSGNLVDHHVIVDLLPALSRLYFLGELPDVVLSRVQSAILVALGLQCQTVDYVVTLMNLPASQILALFNKACRKISTTLKRITSQEIEKKLPSAVSGSAEFVKSNLKMESLSTTLDEDLDKGGKDEMERQHNLGITSLRDMDVSKFAVPGEELDEMLDPTKGIPNSVNIPRSKAEDGKKHQLVRDGESKKKTKRKKLKHLHKSKSK